MIQGLLAPVIVILAIGYALYHLVLAFKPRPGDQNTTCSGCYGACQSTASELIKSSKISK